MLAREALEKLRGISPDTPVALSADENGIQIEPVVCPEHGIPLTCPACIGSRGGRSRSERKSEASRRNGKRRKAAPEVRKIMRKRKVSRQRAHQILKKLREKSGT